MSDEPTQRTSRFGVILVMLAVGGSAVGVVGWHLLSNRNAGLDTSGFDMSTNPDPSHPEAPPSFSTPAPTDSAPAPVQQTSLGMVKGDSSIRPVSAGAGSGSPKAAGAGAAANPTNPKDEAVLTMKEAAIKHEKLVDAFVRRMEKKHPSITKFGKDWAASPELAAIRDQYWKEKDPLKFAYGIARSKDFGKLVKKYATDPGIRDTLTTGIREAPPSLQAAVGGLLKEDKVAKDLMTTVLNAVGLPASLTGFLNGGDVKPPDQNQMISEIMKSAGVKTGGNQTAPVPLDQKAVDKVKEEATNNGFRPLGGGR